MAQIGNLLWWLTSASLHRCPMHERRELTLSLGVAGKTLSFSEGARLADAHTANDLAPRPCRPTLLRRLHRSRARRAGPQPSRWACHNPPFLPAGVVALAGYALRPSPISSARPVSIALVPAGHGQRGAGERMGDGPGAERNAVADSIAPAAQCPSGSLSRPRRLT